eukprot:1968429-Rhodomonas_salina.2
MHDAGRVGVQGEEVGKQLASVSSRAASLEAQLDDILQGLGLGFGGWGQGFGVKGLGFKGYTGREVVSGIAESDGEVLWLGGFVLRGQRFSRWN